MDLNGYKSLMKKLNDIKGISIDQAVTEACLLVERDAKILCPVDMGTLRNSITHDVDNGVGIVGTNMSYAPYVEIGTGLFSSKGNGRATPWSYQDAKGDWHTTTGQMPQPFLQPAYDANESNIKNIISRELDKELKKCAKR